jgi:hypothetical protein
MGHRRPARCLLYPVLLLAAGPGCQALYSYRPVEVLARDAETRQPIPGAVVEISYPLSPTSSAPWNSSGTTGEDGTARLQAAPCGDAGIMVAVRADGYLFNEKNLPTEAVTAAEPGPRFGAGEPRPVHFVVDLYAGPQPTVELVLPVGYRGLVKVEVQVRDDAPCQPGQRCFRYVVPPSGVVQVTGPPLLRCVFCSDFRARYADGTPLGKDAKGQEPGFWWLRREGVYECFFVGTRAEYGRHRLPRPLREG